MNQKYVSICYLLFFFYLLSVEVKFNFFFFLQPFKFLIDYIVIRGMTVRAAKKEILPEVQEKCGLNIPLNRYIPFEFFLFSLVLGCFDWCNLF